MYLQEERARKAANRKARIAADLDAVESDQVITAFILQNGFFQSAAFLKRFCSLGKRQPLGSDILLEELQGCDPLGGSEACSPGKTEIYFAAL